MALVLFSLVLRISGYYEISTGLDSRAFLFLIYINHPPDLIKDSQQIVLFADDTSVLFKLKRQQSVTDDVNDAFPNVVNWLNVNNLLFKEIKTKRIRFFTFNNK